MNKVVFETKGEWETTTLYVNGDEYLASELFVELHAGAGDYDDVNRGGVADGGEMTAIVRPQSDPDQQDPIFPGSLLMRFPGHEITVRNEHPAFAFEFTSVWHNGRDVSNNIVDLFVDINSVTNIVKAYITLYKAHWLSADEVATYNIIG